jgi:hypothetical protein
MSEQTTYPDVLGMLSDERLTIDDVLQCALGVFPHTTALGKPVEVLLLLQNLTNQPLALQLTMRMPMRDDQGQLLNLFTPRPRLPITLPAGDAGLLHIPVTPQIPTLPGSGYPIGIDIQVAPPDAYARVRSVSGGEPAGMLAISPFRVTVLKDIAFGAQSTGQHQLGVTLDVLPGRFPPGDHEPAPHYEALWTVRDLERERARTQQVAPQALNVARGLTRDPIYNLLRQRTTDIFGDAGVPLHPGEASFIAKLLTYVMENGLDLEEGFSLASSYWFERLCSLMANEPRVGENLEHLVGLLYSAVIHDGVLLGFSMVSHDTGVSFGSLEECEDYAAHLIGVLEGRAPASLEHVYVPLVLAGTLLNARISLSDENPWRNLAALREARDGRVSLAGAGFHEVFDILNQLIQKGERLLVETGVPRE